ncbi:MAG: rRNA maturation RNase YbeY [Candidatus Komeilibacteria bacterium]|nr:rRNA maturation RNase YbeY [Candidatus Komeilibacteria bacterium]
MIKESNINIITEVICPVAVQRAIKISAQTAVTKLKLQEIELNIIVTTQTALRRLNKTYRQKDKSTDVLSFLYDQPPVGEIYLSLAQARVQAKKYELSLVSEVSKLVIHGLVHLAGYDHETDKQWRTMKVWEERILKDLPRL